MRIRQIGTQRIVSLLGTVAVLHCVLMLASSTESVAGTDPIREAEQSSKEIPPDSPPARRLQGGSRSMAAMQIHYLEIVTPDVDAHCATLETVHGVSFSAADPGLGGARTAALPNGGMIGVRAPMRDTEEPVVRPYLLVDDIDAAVAAAEKAGGEIAIPPMEIPGHGKFAIYLQGGIDHGLWQH